MNNRQYPKIIEQERADLGAKSIRVKKEIEGKLEEARGLLKKDPDFARVKTAEAQESGRIFKEFVNNFQIRLSNFDAARLSYESKIQNADNVITSVIGRLTELKEKGYFITPDAALSPAKNKLKIARDLLGKKDDVPDYPLVIKHAEGAVKEAEATQNFWRNQCDLRSTNEIRLASVRLWREESLPQSEDSCQVNLNALKTKTPPDVWEPIVGEIRCDETKSQLDNLIKEAERLNGMEKQDFATAGVIIDKIQKTISAIKVKLERPAKILQEFAEAQVKVKNISAQLDGTISRAERAVSDSDAEGVGRDKLRKAKEDVSRAKYLEKSNLPNWLLLAGILAGAITLAQTAEREAKGRAEEVERARRKKREEEDDNEYHHSSSWSSGSSIGSSGGGGGGFGGFGGGSFGGGGASGGW